MKLFYETFPPDIPDSYNFGGFGGALDVEYDSTWKVCVCMRN